MPQPEMLAFFSLMFGTLVSEDLACITAGLLIERGQAGTLSAISACALGIFAGDVGLWGIGRAFGRATLGWSWSSRRLQPDRVAELRSWLGRHAGRAIVASRFLPGTRLPLYVVAGIVGLRGSVFGAWALVGALAWTPALVLLTARFGDAFIARVSPVIGPTWLAQLVAAAVLLVILRGVRAAGSPSNV